MPTNSDDWLPFLERTGGLAPDLPGFGRSGKPGNLDYTIDGYADFIERFLDLVAVERVSLVVHDWGSVGLAFAQRHPERVARLVVINAIPFLPGYRWHRTARIWRTPLLGELAMGATTRAAHALLHARGAPRPRADARGVAGHGARPLRPGHPARDPAPVSQLALRRARRRRRAPGDAGDARARACGAMHDPYIPARFGRAYAEALPDAELLELPDAGHWPWLDRPDADRRASRDFLGGDSERAAAGVIGTRLARPSTHDLAGPRSAPSGRPRSASARPVARPGLGARARRRDRRSRSPT